MLCYCYDYIIDLVNTNSFLKEQYLTVLWSLLLKRFHCTHNYSNFIIHLRIAVNQPHSYNIVAPFCKSGHILYPYTELLMYIQNSSSVNNSTAAMMFIRSYMFLVSIL